jgi:hypothetical protein
MRFSNFLNKVLMGKQIMHSARALFLTFLALEKSKRNSTSHEDCPTADCLTGWGLAPFFWLRLRQKNGAKR